MSLENGNTIKWRIEQLEKSSSDTQQKLDLILTNHLPHIQAEMEGMKSRVTILAAINLGAILLAAIISAIIR